MNAKKIVAGVIVGAALFTLYKVRSSRSEPVLHDGDEGRGANKRETNLAADTSQL